MRRVLILQAGSADPALRARFGDYPDWFARHLAARVELRVVRPYEQLLPSFVGFDGLLMTGSPKSVVDPEPWMDDAAGYLLEAARTRPVLGVCFGHQLLARALGGRVERNPRGREAGTAAVRLTPEGARDLLFAGLDSPLLVQQTHEDHVAALPAGATLLAENEMTPVQAFAWGDNVRCVQFHPEFDAERSRLLAEVRRERLDLQAPGGAAAVRASIRDTPDATSLLGRWLEQFVGG
ncbi:MAG TPA: gamma-glutamyl-gamma-aminobutyrate hydrolase family protein [Anaeromyxobacteraceae bacterium]